MPYSRSPNFSTYDTQRIDFPLSPLQRSGLTPSKDASLMNMMVDVTKGPKKPQIYFRSRAGLQTAFQQIAGVGRGIHYWLYNNITYCVYVIGNKVYVNGGASVQTLATSTGDVGFTEHVSSVGVVTLFMSDGTNGYLFTNPTTAPTLVIGAKTWIASSSQGAGAMVTPTVPNGYVYTTTTGGTTSGTQPTWPTIVGNTVVDGSVTWTCGLSNFPSPHSPSPQFMDGYIFIADTKENIWNCSLDDPLTWPSANFISAEMYPDNIVCLSKNNNYVYAVGRLSVEYFYDAGNATGSPLARQTPAVQQFGTAAAGSVVQTEEEVILIGDTGNGGKTVWTIDGFKAKEVGTTFVKGVLLTEGTNISNANGYSIRVSGQKLYVVQLTSRTLVYNFDTDLWCEWSSGPTGASRFIGYNADDGPGGTPYLLDATSGTVYTMSENVFSDNGTNFLCQIVTEKQDFGTMNRKTCSSFSLIGDSPDSVDNTVNVSWSDDDYTTWSNPVVLTMTDTAPFITQLGQFRRRAFRIKYNLPHLFRIEACEIEINKGFS